MQVCFPSCCIMICLTSSGSSSALPPAMAYVLLIGKSDDFSPCNPAILHSSTIVIQKTHLNTTLINRKLRRVSSLGQYSQSLDNHLAQRNLSRKKENSAHQYSRDASTKLVSAMFKRQERNVDPDCVHLLVEYLLKVFTFKS